MPSSSLGSEPCSDRSQGADDSIRADRSHQAVIGHTINNEGGITYKIDHHHYYGSEACPTIPKWLANCSPFNFDEKHRDTYEVAKKTPDTWKWVLNKPEFKLWRDWQANSEDEKPRTLLCSGILGAGKTVLASVVIEHLRNKLRSSDGKCLFIYFDFRDRERHSLRNLYSSLLAQLVRGHNNSFTEEANAAFTTWKKKEMTPTPDEYLKILTSEIKKLTSVYIVIDALDECWNDTQNTTMPRLLRSLRSLPPNTHVLFTTRQNLGIERDTQSHYQILVQAEREDLRKYLHSRVADRGDIQSMFSEQNSEKKVFDHIIERSKGMFLLAQLHMDFLLTMPASEFNDGVKALPETPDNVYKRTLERIAHLDPPKKALALRCLGWLVLAERPLKIKELLQAVSVKVSNIGIMDGIAITEESVTAVCTGIVVVDPVTRIVRLAHYTARGYLEKNRIPEPRRFHSEMAEVCLTYLSLANIRPTSQSESEVEARGKKYPLLNYAADYWGCHVSRSSLGQVRQKACEFLEDEAKLSNALQAMTEPRFKTEKKVTGLHLVAYFNLSRLAKAMIDKKRVFVLNAQTTTGETAVHWAAFYGHADVLRVLIEGGADLDTKDIAKRTALHKATMNNDHESVRMILDSRRADTQIEDNCGWTALRWAASNGQQGLVSILLESDANIDAQDKDSWTALRWAAHKGNNKILRLLIRKNASLGCKDGWTVLSWAAREGKHEIITLLAERGVDLDAIDSNGEPALTDAIRYGHGKAVYALLEAKAKVDLKDSKTQTPLHVAIDGWESFRNKTIVWLLLESGADINAQTRLGYTPLHIAAMKGHNPVVWLLLQKGADPFLKDNTGQIALHLAVVEGREEVVSSLYLWVPKLVSMRNHERRTALHEAASSGNLNLVVGLYHGKSKIDAVDREGCTALHRAVIHLHREIVLFLISKDADVNLANKKGNTALHEAAASGESAIIEALLSKGHADETLINAKGRTPRQVARRYGHESRYQEISINGV